MLRCAIIDDDEGYLSLCRDLARRRRDVRLVGTSTSGTEIEQLVRRKRPDVVLLDLAMPDVDGLSLLPRALASGALVMVVTANDYGPLRELATDAGAHAVLAKSPVATLFDRVLDEVAVHHGQA